MVVCAAVGGREWLLGAIYGSLVVNFGKTFFSEQFPQLWLFMIGGLFIGVVMVFPRGLAGINRTTIRAAFSSWRTRRAARASSSTSTSTSAFIANVSPRLAAEAVSLPQPAEPPVLEGSGGS
jgi:urea transport system permease protein